MGGRVVASLKLTASVPLKIGWLGDNPCFSWGPAHFSGAFAVSSREGTFLPNKMGRPLAFPATNCGNMATLLSEIARVH